MRWYSTKSTPPKNKGFYLLYGRKSGNTVEAYWNGEEFWFCNVSFIHANMTCANPMKATGTHWAKMPAP